MDHSIYIETMGNLFKSNKISVESYSFLMSKNTFSVYVRSH